MELVGLSDFWSVKGLYLHSACIKVPIASNDFKKRVDVEDPVQLFKKFMLGKPFFGFEGSTNDFFFS